MVADELIAQLKKVSGVGAVFDTDVPDRFTVGQSPTLVLQHISTVGAQAVDGTLYGGNEQWQVSVRGSHLGNVRAAAQAVKNSLHGFSSASIKRCDFDSWPGTIRESANPVEYHAPVSFNIFN